MKYNPENTDEPGHPRLAKTVDLCLMIPRHMETQLPEDDPLWKMVLVFKSQAECRRYIRHSESGQAKTCRYRLVTACGELARVLETQNPPERKPGLKPESEGLRPTCQKRKSKAPRAPLYLPPQPRPGRPMKYRHFIEILDDDTVYSPAAIYEWGKEQGLVDKNLAKEEEQKLKLRIRHTMARFSANHQFPRKGDGMVLMKGQSAVIGWSGKRWKGAL